MENNTIEEKMTLESNEVGSLENVFGFTEEELNDNPHTKTELAEEEQASENSEPGHKQDNLVNEHQDNQVNAIQENQGPVRKDENLEPAVPEPELLPERESRGEYPTQPEEAAVMAMPQEELDTMILSERANAMIEYIQNRMVGEKRADRVKQATIAITMILKAKKEALNAMRAGRI